MSAPTGMPANASRGRDWSLRRHLAWQLALTAGAVLALLVGWWGLRAVLRRPVVQTLRQAAEG